MAQSVPDLLAAYDASAPLECASTIPASWYTDERIAALERRTVFAHSWQMAGRLDQLREPGDYVTADVAGEPVVVVRGADGVLRAFYNVCRHHAAAVATAAHGNARHLVCPYHGWTYSLAGALLAAPQFAGVCGFEAASNGLVPVALATQAGFAFVRIADAPAPDSALESTVVEGIGISDLDSLAWTERRQYVVECNWKVYVDNYLDGGYHVPHLHHGLDSVLAPGEYTIELGERHCVQSSPLRTRDPGNPTAAVRRGERAHYYWIYPNFMINRYAGVMDTNLVVPLGTDRCAVIFDYWFADASAEGAEARAASIAVSERIQEEDAAICASVQRGLRSRSYTAGRLSVRREAGEHLFHRLLHADLVASGN
jgi:choline monooxygenase